MAERFQRGLERAFATLHKPKSKEQPASKRYARPHKPRAGK
jgi:hypothetical protein